MKTKNIKLSPYSWTYGKITHLFIKWMISQAYNNNDVLLFPLQIWKQPHQNKVFWPVQLMKKILTVFEHLHEDNTKPLVNESVSHTGLLIF